jgi:Cu-Zn family superoxide dismutase
MKTISGPWASLLFLSLAVLGAACSSDDSPASGDAAAGSAGTSGGAGTDGGGTGGGAGSGGTAGSGGAAGSGGSADGAAGALSDGGGDAAVAAEAGSDSAASDSAASDSAASDSAASDSAASDSATGDAGVKITSSTGTWVVYPDPFGADAGDNPLPSTIMGKAEAFALPGGKMRITLSVTGLPPNRPCGSHLHVLTCENNKAGGHYQNVPFPMDGGVASDPTFANSANEVWLDFTSDANGAAMAETTVDWVPRAGGANAIMIHDKKTGDGGIAGAKLACTNMPF